LGPNNGIDWPGLTKALVTELEIEEDLEKGFGEEEWTTVDTFDMAELMELPVKLGLLLKGD
jgi:hypothetical protein